MITLLPSYRETLVLARSGEDTYRRLLVSTSQKPFIQPDESELLFTGWVRPDRLRVSLRNRRPSHFLPLVIGKLEVSSSGCILLLHYRLFPTVGLLIQLWSILIVIGTLMTGYSYRTYTPALFGVLLLLIMYLIAWSNFFLHLRPTREAIRRVVA